MSVIVLPRSVGCGLCNERAGWLQRPNQPNGIREILSSEEAGHHPPVLGQGVSSVTVSDDRRLAQPQVLSHGQCVTGAFNESIETFN